MTKFSSVVIEASFYFGRTLLSARRREGCVPGVIRRTALAKMQAFVAIGSGSIGSEPNPAATAWHGIGAGACEQPRAAEGLVVTKFADKLDHPRWLYVLPDGAFLVAETNAPKRPDDARGVRGTMMRLVMKRTGDAVPARIASAIPTATESLTVDTRFSPTC